MQASKAVCNTVYINIKLSRVANEFHSSSTNILLIQWKYTLGAYLLDYLCSNLRRKSPKNYFQHAFERVFLVISRAHGKKNCNAHTQTIYRQTILRMTNYFVFENDAHPMEYYVIFSI